MIDVSISEERICANIVFYWIEYELWIIDKNGILPSMNITMLIKKWIRDCFQLWGIIEIVAL